MSEQHVLILELLEEVEEYLSNLPGSGIASVKAGIARYRRGNFHKIGIQSSALVDAWLPRCLDLLALDDTALAARVSAALPTLAWTRYDGYNHALIGEEFALKHAYSSLIGDNSPLYAPDFDFGLFLIAPNVLYRDHSHYAPELYLPLTGPHGWRFTPNAPLEIKQGYEPIWNEPHCPHLTKVGPEPFLSLYCWTRDNDKAAVVVPAKDWFELEALQL